MNSEQQELYDEGYQAYHKDVSEDCNPYRGIDAEYWGDGWEDAKDDEVQL